MSDVSSDTAAVRGDELEAGRELDALVAVLLGWKVIETDDCGGVDNFWLSADGQHPWMDDVGMDTPMPEYSTDIASAWEVVEKMREHPDPARRTLKLVAYSYNRTYAAFDTYADRDDSYCEANGPHATPLAICRAALAATPTTAPVTPSEEDA